MRKILLTFFAASLIQSSTAQITITDSDMPVTGTPYYRDQGNNLTVIDPAITGANQTWDYSQLGVVTTDTTEYVPVSSTPLLYQFYFNNIVLYNSWKADLALPGPDIGTQIPGSPIAITDVINYYKVTTSALFQVGFGATINTIPASQRYDPRDKILKLPNTFGLVDSNDFAWLLAVPGIGSLGQTKTRSNETDGWGTLQLPFASYNTLRVKSTITGIDTFYLDLAGFGLGIASTQYEYRWYAIGEGEPVLIVNASDALGTITVNAANFKHTDPTGIYNYSGPVSETSFGPNPASDLIVLHYQTLQADRLQISLHTSLTGQEVLKTDKQITAGTKNQISLDIHNLAKGFYTLKVKSQIKTVLYKVVIQ